MMDDLSQQNPVQNPPMTEPVMPVQTPPVEQPPPPPPPSRSFLSKPLIILLIVVFLFAIFYAGTYFKLNKILTNITNPPKPTPSPTAPIPSPTPDPTANWKTYTNTKYGLSFKYPPGLEISSDMEFPNVNRLQVEFSGDNYGMPRMTIVLYAEKDAQENQAALNTILSAKKLNNFKYSQISTKKIDGQILYSYVEDFDYSSGKLPPVGGPLFQLRTSGMIKNVFYEIYYPYQEKTLKQDQEIFNQILSTFKFLEANPEGQFCGGIAANLPKNQCPSGYKCQLEGNYPDASGKCVKE